MDYNSNTYLSIYQAAHLTIHISPKDSIRRGRLALEDPDVEVEDAEDEDEH